MRRILVFLLLAVAAPVFGQTGPNPTEVCGVFAPNAFTPNRDNTNDLFGVVVSEACEMVTYQLRVFDRYGRLVFESSDPRDRWDGNYNGRAMKEGTYLWQLNATYVDPDGTNQVRLAEQGSVVLIR
jgi:gliding motility-associated-like protein